MKEMRYTKIDKILKEKAPNKGLLFQRYIVNLLRKDGWSVREDETVNTTTGTFKINIIASTTGYVCTTCNYRKDYGSDVDFHGLKKDVRKCSKKYGCKLDLTNEESFEVFILTKCFKKRLGFGYSSTVFKADIERLASSIKYKIDPLIEDYKRVGESYLSEPNLFAIFVSASGYGRKYQRKLVTSYGFAIHFIEFLDYKQFLQDMRMTIFHQECVQDEVLCNAVKEGIVSNSRGFGLFPLELLYGSCPWCETEDQV